MVALVPVMLLVTVSVAVRVRLPAVRRVALNEPVPLVRVASAGRVGLPSVTVQCPAPAYPVAVLLKASLAATVKMKAAPAVALEGALTVNCAAAAALTVMALLVPVI